MRQDSHRMNTGNLTPKSDICGAQSVLVKQNCNTSVQNFSEKLRIYSTVSLTMSL